MQNPTPASLKQILANVAKTELIAKSHAGTVPMVFIHICFAIIDLPDGGYSGYSDFRVQMENTLFAPESWRFTALRGADVHSSLKHYCFRRIRDCSLI